MLTNTSDPRVHNQLSSNQAGVRVLVKPLIAETWALWSHVRTISTTKGCSLRQIILQGLTTMRMFTKFMMIDQWHQDSLQTTTRDQGLITDRLGKKILESRWTIGCIKCVNRANTLMDLSSCMPHSPKSASEPKFNRGSSCLLYFSTFA